MTTTYFFVNIWFNR